MEAISVNMEDQKPVAEMVPSVTQATEIAMSEIKRERDALKLKKDSSTLKRKPPTRRKRIQSRLEGSF